MAKKGNNWHYRFSLVLCMDEGRRQKAEHSLCWLQQEMKIGSLAEEGWWIHIWYVDVKQGSGHLLHWQGYAEERKNKLLTFMPTKKFKSNKLISQKFLFFNSGGLSWLPWIHIKQERVIGYINRIFHHQCSHLVNYLDAPLRGKRFKWTPKGKYLYVMLETDGISSKFNRMALKLCWIEIVKYINSICRIIWAPSKSSY